MLAVSRLVLRHKLLVAGFWLAVLAAGVFASAQLGSRLSQQVTIPGAAGYQANLRISRLYGNGGPGYPEVAVVTLPAGEPAASAGGRAALARTFGAVASAGGLRVADYANTGNRAFLTREPRVSYGLVFTPYAGEGGHSLAPQITAAMRPVLPPGSQVRVTGMNELKSGGQAKQSLGVLAETLTAGAAALAVLVLVFGSALAIVPMLMAAVAIPATFLAVYGLTQITSVFFVVQYLVALIGLGVAIDYSLLLVTRWREELTAGAGPAWTSWARRVVRRKWAAAAAAVAILGALGAAAAGIKVGEPAASALGTTSPAAQTLRMLEHAGVPAGVLDPIEVLVPATAKPAQLAHRLAGLPGVRAAVAPRGPAWRRGGTALVSVQPVAEASTAAGAATITGVRHLAAAVPGTGAGGPGALLLDENHAFYSQFPLLIAILAVITIALLARAFGSLLLPVKAVLLNLASVGATYGVIVLVWQDGHGSQAIWGLPATGAITNWVPLVAFAFLYGLSMDYEVFILTRIREEHDRTGSTSAGIVEGIGRTGRLVTSAALILFLALAALTTGPETDVKVMATALGAGILLDATVVRALLVPALVAILGRASWWLPGPASRLLRVPAPLPPPKPATPRPSAPAQTP